MSDHYELPEPDPDLKPLPPNLLDNLVRRADEYETKRQKVAVARAAVLLLLLGLAVYAAVWTHRIRQKQDETPQYAPFVPPQRVVPHRNVVPKSVPKSDTSYARDPIKVVPKK